jgi:putative membrane protein
MTLACAAVVISVSHIFHLGLGLTFLAVYLPAGLVALVGLTLLDFVMLRWTPVNKLSKVVHVSSFASLLWALTVLVGILADAVFAKQAGSADYVVAGMFLAASLRIGIFVSVFGAGVGRAVAICLVQPLAFFFAFVPPSHYAVLVEPVGVSFGTLFVALVLAWTILADRAGRPQVESTFRLLQAFLSAITENKTGAMEEYIESKAHDEPVSTTVVRFSTDNSETALVLPDVHPGPFGAVGGSNLPYVLFEHFSRRALVMHSVSDHSLNIPSKREVDRYIASLGGLGRTAAGSACSEPAQERQGSATATAIAFGRNALVMLSLAPKGMEDVPQSVRAELESHASALGFDLLLADCHNAMGKHITAPDSDDLVAAAKRCLDSLKDAPQHEFKVGFASLGDIPHRLAGAEELGQAGLAVMVLGVAGKSYAIGWADSNNMENSLRDRIIESVNGEGSATMLEVCSSDTHSTSGKRTKEGYYSLGSASNHDDIAGAYLEMCRKAAQGAKPTTFEVVSATTDVKVMGEGQFGDYSSALDRSMKVTKTFIAVTAASFIAMQVLA